MSVTTLSDIKVTTLSNIKASKFREDACSGRGTLSNAASVDRIDLSLNVLPRLAHCCKVLSQKNWVREVEA
jgi:hypothetical protein